ADVGLPEGGASGRRRTPGLRREEVAQLSGVGVTWYTWLEQGRPISASGQVIDAIGRALQLTPDEHEHLRRLAGLPAPERAEQAADLTPRLQRLVDAALPNLASVCDIHFDYLAWNRAYTLLRQDPAVLPADRRNLLWMMFAGPGRGAGTRHWEAAARSVLSQFRIAASQRPTDPRFAELVAALTEASPEFRAWWAEYPVRSFRPVTIVIDHPAAGPVTLELYQLRLAERPDLTLVLQVPVSAEDLRRVTVILDDAAREARTGVHRSNAGQAQAR
ncbi:MAG: helix-turn-helix domain-containing protein, partial [Actinobacteria bacterium]|nr:helix-turn-helix domain-containing protein [Actinomycetota bacterium]